MIYGRYQQRDGWFLDGVNKCGPLKMMAWKDVNVSNRIALPRGVSKTLVEVPIKFGDSGLGYRASIGVLIDGIDVD